MADYKVFPVYEEPEEGEELDLEAQEGSTDDYFDFLFDDLDIDYDLEDQYA